MKIKLLICGLIWAITTAAATAGLWSPPLLNPSFEDQSLLGGKGWENWVDDWFDSSYWGTFIQSEGGDTPDTSYGKNLGGCEGVGGAMYQQIGTWEENRRYEASFLIGKVKTRAFGGLRIALWGGGNPALAADYDEATNISVEITGATMIDSKTLLPWPDNPTTMLTDTATVLLETGSGLVTGDPLWFQASQTVGSSAQAFFDNFIIAPSLRAWGPDPANGAKAVPVDKILSWKTGENPPGQPNPTITGHKVYMSACITDPNITSPPLTLVATLPVSQAWYDPPADLQRDGRYFWRVDEVISTTSVITGFVWSFETLLSRPMIQDDTPADLLVTPGQTAIFTVKAVNPYTLDNTGMNYQWYKYVNGVSDTPVGTNSSTLTITNVSASNEGRYYCKVTLISNSKVSTSRLARLTVKRLIGHWKLDGNATDSSGSGSDGELIDPPVGHTSWVTGVNGLALNISDTGYPYVEISADKTSIYNLTERISVSIWAKSPSTPSGYGVLIGKQADNVTRPWMLRQNGTNPWVTWKTHDSFDAFPDAVVFDEQWHNVVATWDMATGEKRVYVDGETKGIITGFTTPGQSAVCPVRIGYYYSSYTCANAILDDARIYNYALDPYEVADLYTAVTGLPVCVEYPEHDFNGDCRVGIEDIAELVAEWLECNLYPQSACE